MRGAPPIIFEWLTLPQQIIYRRKGNLSESPNHLKYWENILISRFYEQFSRSSWNLGHFGNPKKFQTLRAQTYHISFWSGWSGDSKYIICFAKYLNFAKIKAIMYFAKFLNAFVKPRNLNFSGKKIIYLESPDHPLQNDIWYICVLRVWNFFELPKMA